MWRRTRQLGCDLYFMRRRGALFPTLRALLAPSASWTQTLLTPSPPPSLSPSSFPHCPSDPSLRDPTFAYPFLAPCGHACVVVPKHGLWTRPTRPAPPWPGQGGYKAVKPSGPRPATPRHAPPRRANSFMSSVLPPWFTSSKSLMAGISQCTCGAGRSAVAGWSWLVQA